MCCAYVYVCLPVSYVCMDGCQCIVAHICVCRSYLKADDSFERKKVDGITIVKEKGYKKSLESLKQGWNN